MTQEYAGQIEYEKMVRDALRGVVRRILRDAAATGLPGEHHFYIVFDTHHPGVRIPDHLRAQFPEDMTIVLQHQFWDLDIDDEKFGVTLSFNGKPERLTVPFEALLGFLDPSVQFGLQFDPAEEGGTNLPVTISDAETGGGNDKPVSDAPRQQTENDPDGQNVVALDAFRKK